VGGKKGKIGGEEKRGGEVEGVKKGTKEGGGEVGQTREKEEKRRGERGWLGGGKVGQEGMGGGNEGGGRTCIYTMEYHHTKAPYSFTIQDHHTIKMQTFRDYHAILCQAIHIISHDNLVW